MDTIDLSDGLTGLQVQTILNNNFKSINWEDVYDSVIDWTYVGGYIATETVTIGGVVVQTSTYTWVGGNLTKEVVVRGTKTITRDITYSGSNPIKQTTTIT